ncbi:hypothetical protein MA4S0726RA_0148 [Mycobacteroides abscessus 4S-0726-RA]|nr:hypothetical protein MA4S0726RA_0148 [Mycobacteroides abscessus 4S-0726-RA]EIV61271.1 hypothetical protein MA4S0116S_4182 [Mycobacteroides abscessus 4S-0116-S]
MARVRRSSHSQEYPPYDAPASHTSTVTEDTWSNRDLPALRAVVDIYERRGLPVVA